LSKILVLGCGLIGPTAAKDCAESAEVTKVVGCDVDEEKLKKAEEFVASPKFETASIDVTDHEALVDTMRGFDVAINATAARFSLGVLEAAMEVGIDLHRHGECPIPVGGRVVRQG